MSKETVNLCYNDLYIQKAIQRAAHFIGIIASPANSLGIESYNIIEDFQLFSHPPIEVESEILSEFRNFIINHSLREMIESFDKALINAFEVIAFLNGKINSSKFNEITEEVIKFKKSKFPNKLIKINALLNNKLTEQNDFWKVLKNIRNCITHNMSIVDQDEISIQIPYIREVIKDLITGEETIINLTGDFFKAPASSIHEIQTSYLNKTFKRGEIIYFNYEEITYIIYAMWKYCDHFNKTILDYMESNKEHMQKFNYTITDRTPHLAIFSNNSNDVVAINPLDTTEPNKVVKYGPAFFKNIFWWIRGK